MKFSEHDRKIIGSKVAKATFKGGVSRLKGKGGEKRNYLVKPGNRPHYLIIKGYRSGLRLTS